MIRHLITLMWNRKRANSLLILEIVLAFVVLFAVGSVGVYTWSNYRAPLGFAYDNVWEIDLSPGTQPAAEQFATFQQILARLRSTPGVVSVTRTEANTPFSFNNSSTNVATGKGAQKRECDRADIYFVSTDLQATMRVEMKEGRWFDRRDEAATRRPVIISEQLRDELFKPGESPLGKTISSEVNGQIVGVSGPYRASGELSEPQPGLFVYVGPNDSTRAVSTLLVRVQPGSGAALEKKISDDIYRIGHTWSSAINTLSDQRLVQVKVQLTPPILLGIVCVFLIVNVMLGLFGVLWLNINQRRGEIGLRRAIGATAATISWQIVGEIVVLTTFGLGLGLLVAVQLPLLSAFDVKPGVYFTAMAGAAGALYLLAVGCALYPSRLAAGIRPAVALREE